MKMNWKKNQAKKQEKKKRPILDPQQAGLLKKAKVRRVKHGSYSMAMTAVVIAGVVVVNLIASEIPSQYTQIDLSGLQLSALSDQTRELAKGLTEDITLYYIVQDGSRDTEVTRLLERYDDLSDHITVVEKDPVVYPKFTAQYTDESVTDNSVIAVCGEKSRVISYDTMYEAEFNYSYYTYETTGFDAEGQITSAIAALSSENLPKMYTLAGHNEITLDETLQASVEKENIETESLNLLTAEKVPEDADCLLIAAPTTDLSEAEAQKVLNYLRTGGKAIILTEYTGTDMPNLESVLEYYGKELVDGVVMESDSNHYVQVPYYLVPNIGSTEVSADLAGGNGYVLLAAAQGLQDTQEQRDGVDSTSVLYTSDNAYSKTNVETMTTYNQEEADISGPFDLAVLITETVELTDELLEETSGTVETAELTDGLELAEAESEAVENISEAESETEEDLSEAESGTAEEASEAESETEELSAKAAETAETKLAIFSSSAILDSSADQMVSGGNSRLFLNTLSWICGETASVSVPVKSLSMDYLTVTSGSGSFWSIVTIALVPGLFLVYGLFIWLKRRKQ